MASPSSTNAPLGVLEEIEALFSWNPPRFFPGTTKLSTATRKPGFFDKHFSKNLVLKRVKQLPSLVEDLATTVDKALSAAMPTLPPLDPSFITAERRKVDGRKYRLKAKDEKAIASFFDKYTAQYCLSLASTLALHPTATFSEWDSLLYWTSSVTSSGYAIMDGQLLLLRTDEALDENIKSHQANIWATIETDKRHILEWMRDSESSLATWEIKGLGAGRSEVMSAVLKLGEFSWTTCPDIDICDEIDLHRKDWEKVREVVVGPDARRPPWSLPSPAEAYETSSSLSSLTSSEDEEPSPATKKGKKRKRDEDDYAEKERKDQKAHLKGHEISAHDLVQHAWAQATRVDGTIIVLHAGNHEIVCVRERTSQALYVSDVIEPHKCNEPGYGKLLVGIYVAAIQDALDRKQQQQPLPVSQPGPPGDGGGGDNQDNNQVSVSKGRGGPSRREGEPKGGRSVEKSDGLQGSAGGKGLTDDEQVIEVRWLNVNLPKADEHQKMIHEASNRDVVLMYFRYGVYDSPVPATFHRSAPPIMTHSRCPTAPFSPRTIHRYRPEECLAIVLTSEIGRGATGVVHRGTLMPEIWDDAIPMDVVVKLAFDVEQRESLRSEYEIYRRLRSKGIDQGITTVLGFFNDSEDGACALVMLHAGVPLSADSQGNLSIFDCQSALSTLKSIHHAGILHGDIRLENILVSHLGITIIDFGHSKPSTNKRAKDEESAQLCHLLGLAGESR